MRDFIVGVTALIISAFFIFLSKDMPLLVAKGYPGPSAFPLILSIISVVCGVVLIVKSIMSLKREGKGLTSALRFGSVAGGFNSAEILNAVKFVVLTAVYIALIPYVGFLLTSLIYMLVVQVVYGVTTLRALGISFTATFSIYILFISLLKVVVPEPILGPILLR